MSLLQALRNDDDVNTCSLTASDIPGSQDDLANPFGLVYRTSFAPQRSGSKRRRRAPITNHTAVSDNGTGDDITTQMFATRQTPTVLQRDQLQHQDSTCNDEDDDSPDQSVSQQPTRRRMRPAIQWMSVRSERKALNEIRNMENPLQKAKEKLKSIPLDITVEEFALHYVIGHHAKRAQSITSKKRQQGL